MKGTNAPGHSGLMKTDFFRPVGYNAAGGGSSDDDPAVDEDPSKVGFKRAFQLFFPLTLRNLTSSIYDVLTGFTRPKDILKSDTRHLEACLRANIGDFTCKSYILGINDIHTLTLCLYATHISNLCL